MTKPETRRTKEIRNQNDEWERAAPAIRHSFGFLVSEFVIPTPPFGGYFSAGKENCCF